MSRAAQDPAGASADSRFGTRALVACAVAVAAAIMFAVLVVLVTSKFDPLLRLDRDTANRLHEFAVAHKSFTALMRAVSDLGTWVAWWLVLAPVLGWLLHRRLARLALFVVVTMLGSTVLNNVVKVAVGRPRPHLVDPVATAAGESFPSGHSQAAVVGYGILLAVFIPFVARRWRPAPVALASLMVLSIGFSRIALGVHYLSDVIGGYLLGGLWLLGMIGAFRARRRDRGQPTAAITEGPEPDQPGQIAP